MTRRNVVALDLAIRSAVGGTVFSGLLEREKRFQGILKSPENAFFPKI